MDNNLSDLISGVLANPEMLSKVMTLLPVVTQMMNSDSSGNPDNKIVETTTVNPANPAPSIPSVNSSAQAEQAAQNENVEPNQNNKVKTPENLMADENVMAALKNLVLALNSANPASPVSPASPPPTQPIQNDIPPPNDAIMTSSIVNNISQLLKNNQNSQNSQNNSNTQAQTANGMNAENNTDNQNNPNNPNNHIEKTLDTLKNISSVTSPDSDHRAKLLLALKPFLKDGRQTKIDTAIKYMNAAKLFSMFGKNGFV